MKTYSTLKIVNRHLNYDHVTLTNPSPHYYIHIALEIDHSPFPFFLFESKLKKKILKKATLFCSEVLKYSNVIEANVFKALLIPPGKGKYIDENSHKVPIAKFDIALLIKVNSKEALTQLINHQYFKNSLIFFEKNSIHFHYTTAKNIRRIDDVDHAKQGVFLFNYFYAEDVEQNLEVWNYTAGWFEKETKLNNSELMLPLNKNVSNYTVINHCRWDTLIDILPSLLFKKTFKLYVLDNFYTNNVGAMPILYKLIT
ncbi:conserved protein of unknown function [Tenacibaculum sp. 190524A02b]|uniref:hypothetical protein n=1 Tax=Tenacibaculum vairaonense TaxID=3137860 RepID=UPI0032B209D8